MEIHFTAEQEAQLTKIARTAGTDPEQLLKDAALRLMQQQDHSSAAVRKGMAEADRGEFISKEEMDARLEAMLRSQQMEIRWTPTAASDLEQISNYLKEHHPRYRQATMRKLYSTITALER